MVWGCALIAVKGILLLAGLVALLGGCSDPAVRWAADTVPVPLGVAVPAETPKSPQCKPMPESVSAEAEAQTPIEALRDGGSRALSAALIASEARKNHRLREALEAYEACRGILSGGQRIRAGREPA
jgi:hypothetical protein